MQNTLIYLGLMIAVATLTAILWSIVFPGRRLWPPKRYTPLTPLLVWIPTFTLSGVLILLGIWGWAHVFIPTWARFGIGFPLIIIGNIVVWLEVSNFGVPQTGGAKGNLRTTGMYSYSRNPQYVADIAIICGWIILSAAPWVIVVGIPAIIVLVVAPFAEEPWLKDQYGSAYVEYLSRVRRFF